MYLYRFMSSCSMLVQISVTLCFWEQASHLTRNSNRLFFFVQPPTGHALHTSREAVEVDTLPLLQWCLTTTSVPLNKTFYVNLYFLCNMYRKESCRVPGLEVQDVQQKWIKTKNSPGSEAKQCTDVDTRHQNLPKSPRGGPPTKRMQRKNFWSEGELLWNLLFTGISCYLTWRLGTAVVFWAYLTYLWPVWTSCEWNVA